ncbi:MAG: AbrB/MazE/SpoVT family DNA-binding domain-containing protein [Chloroflexi bacterium]|nr:AbrB/MazE/SpoVT family DNA-binding domain-containing protein [Chloroflexota bacterium]
MARQSDTKVRVGPQWRVVIPSSIRKALGLNPGDTLTARVEEGRLVLEKRQHILVRLKKRYAAVPPGVSLVEDLVAERRAEAQQEEER